MSVRVETPVAVEWAVAGGLFEVWTLDIGRMKAADIARISTETPPLVAVGAISSQQRAALRVDQTESLPMRTIWLVLGATSLGLAVIGAFLPLLPTTPLVLLAAFFFGKSSPAFERWLVEHPTFGPAIRDWRERGAISRRGKIAATVAIALSMAVPLLAGFGPAVLLVQVVALGAVLSFVLTRPTAD
jgi:uncharacterized protein